MGEGAPRVVHAEACWGCETCSGQCPVHAIRIEATAQAAQETGEQLAPPLAEEVREQYREWARVLREVLGLRWHPVAVSLIREGEPLPDVPLPEERLRYCQALMAARRGRVYAVERKDAAFDILRENLRRFHTDNVTPVSGTAPDACADLPAPTHAFLGGTTGHMKEIIALLLEKNPRVRIVATAVTLESVAELTECVKAFPFRETEAVSLTAARSRKAGAYHLMTGQNPVYIFTMQG